MFGTRKWPKTQSARVLNWDFEIVKMSFEMIYEPIFQENFV